MEINNFKKNEKKRKLIINFCILVILGIIFIISKFMILVMENFGPFVSENSFIIIIIAIFIIFLMINVFSFVYHLVNKKKSGTSCKIYKRKYFI